MGGGRGRMQEDRVVSGVCGVMVPAGTDEGGAGGVLGIEVRENLVENIIVQARDG